MAKADTLRKVVAKAIELIDKADVHEGFGTEPKIYMDQYAWNSITDKLGRIIHESIEEKRTIYLQGNLKNESVNIRR